MKASELKEIKLKSQKEKVAEEIENVTKMLPDLVRIVLEYMALIQWFSLSKDQAKQKIKDKDFRDCLFTSADLKDSSLKASFSSADLRETNFSQANLTWVNLAWANLSGVNLSGVNLTWVDFRGANLHSTDLSGANLCSADLRGADLREANLHSADLSDAKLNGANLSGAKLSLSNLPYVLNNSFVILSSDAKDIKIEKYIHILRSYIAAVSILWFSSDEHDKKRAKVLLLELIQTQSSESPIMQNFLSKGLLPDEKEMPPYSFFQGIRHNPFSNSLRSQLQEASKEALKSSASAGSPGRKL